MFSEIVTLFIVALLFYYLILFHKYKITSREMTIISVLGACVIAIVNL